MDKEVFNLPENAYVNKFVAKNRFYERSALSSKVRKDFVDKIQKIVWKYKLSEDTIGISKTDNVIEIQIFDIILKEKVIPENVLKIIDKAIPYQILYRFISDKDVAYGITLKENTRVENYYFSNWNEELSFDFTGINLEKVYQKLVKAFIKNKNMDPASFDEIIKQDTKIKTLEKEILQFKKRISSEKQFNRKVDLNKILLSKKSELEKINGDK